MRPEPHCRWPWAGPTRISTCSKQPAPHGVSRTPILAARTCPPTKPLWAKSSRTPAKRTINYIYDFGDNWEHRIKIGRITDPVPGELYPRLIEVTGKCPPEDVGGFPGYYGFLDAMARSKASRARSSQRLVWRHLRSQSARNRQTQTRSPQSRKTLEARKTKEIRLSDRTLTI